MFYLKKKKPTVLNYKDNSYNFWDLLYAVYVAKTFQYILFINNHENP